MGNKYAKLFAGAATVALAATSLGAAGAVAQDDGFAIVLSHSTQASKANVRAG